MEYVSVSAAEGAAERAPELVRTQLQSSTPLRTTRPEKQVAADRGNRDKTDQIQRSARNAVRHLLIQFGYQTGRRLLDTEEARSRVVETWV